MMIETKNLTKQFDGLGGCKDISLSVSEGHIFGFLGPNGAGKSTFVKTLLGLLQPTGGQAYIMGETIGNVQIRKNVGYLPELFRYHDWLTGEQLLKFHAELYGLTKSQYKKRIGEALEVVGLLGKEKQKIGTYSKGMQQRIGLAVALIHNPQLVFLDEPTSALDPIGRKEVRDIIIELKRAGKTVFLNSHLLSEVEAVCDEIAIINKGNLIINGSWHDLQVGEIQLEMFIHNYSYHITEKLSTIAGKIEKKPTGSIVLTLENEKDINKVLKIVLDNGGVITRIETKKKTLEDLFIFWINKEGGADDYNN